MARIMRSVWASRGRSKYEWLEATTTSSLVEACVRQVEAAVFEDVDLDTFENCETVQPLIQPINLATLPAQPRGIETVGHGDAAAVVGERDVFVAARPCRLGHGFDGSGAVGPVGMDMEIPANIRRDYQTRQLVRRCKRNLTAILAQFGWDEGQSEFFVDFFFGEAGNPPPAGKQAVLVELPAAMQQQDRATRCYALASR